jgi:diadenosine tetraphosphatase ApaH/serine/threonine PP2A family protein phosphatase
VVQGAVAASRNALDDEDIQELAALPFDALLSGTRYCHGSPVSDVRSFFPEPADDEAELLEGQTERKLVFGHTHLPFHRISAAGVELANPGSVGMPFDGDPRAAYAIVHPDGVIEHRRVEYDHTAAAARVRELGGEWTGTVAARIERAAFAV